MHDGAAPIRPLGYTGSLTHLQRLLNGWRRAHFAAVITASAPECPVLPDGNLRPPGQLIEPSLDGSRFILRSRRIVAIETHVRATLHAAQSNIKRSHDSSFSI
jgi:hypothetical protein